MAKVYRYIVIFVACAALLALSYVKVVRWDMTDDRHYSLSPASKALLQQTDAPVEVTLLLDGDLNAGFRRLKKATEETIEEMNVYAQITNDKRPTTNDQRPISLTPSVSTLSSSMNASRTARRRRRRSIPTR